ncbi:P-loop containing nucleoside triphosphate hydrolase protein [Mycena galopus ATCC 62051]|nr:P-loop containing nucleoside triphosphate hydrolase protein [Mycena galopus ATCC 62051]
MFLRGRQGVGKIRQLFRHADIAAQLQECKNELEHSLGIFRIQVGVGLTSAPSGMARMHGDSQTRHEELLRLIAECPELTSSGPSSPMTSSLSGAESVGSLSLLPPVPQIFHGRDVELQAIVNILKQDSARITILGPAGIGKTSLAVTTLHHPTINVLYTRRFFVPCDSIVIPEDLVSQIASHVGVEKSASLSRKVIYYFRQSPRTLLILDNFETIWESLLTRAEVEEFLSLLSDIGHLGILITMRGAERPSKVKWTHPFLPPLKPLSDDAAMRTFIDIADENHDKEKIRRLLKFTGNLPLAVQLMANVASHEGCDTALFRWTTESTRLLSDGYDSQSSLDISIMLSLSSSRMTSGAQALLSLLSILPDGLSDADLVQSRVPIRHILTCKSTLLATSLAYVENERLKTLAPIREHVRAAHLPSAALRLSLRRYFHDILDLWKKLEGLQFGDVIPQISGNLGNLNALLGDALENDCPDIIESMHSILCLNDFYDTTVFTRLPLMAELSDKIVQWKHHPIYGDYLIEIFHTGGCHPLLTRKVK